jgi:hypothetical protein
MARLTLRDSRVQTPVAGAKAAPVKRPDWRGWIGVAWVVFWGSAYALMAIQTRAPQILRWVARFTGNAISP